VAAKGSKIARTNHGAQVRPASMVSAQLVRGLPSRRWFSAAYVELMSVAIRDVATE
jgi:hypothetical protein